MTPSTTRFLSHLERHKRTLAEGCNIMLCPICWGSPYYYDAPCKQCSGRGELLVKDVPASQYL